MITLQQYVRLLREYARSQNMSVSALKAGVDRRTARKYLNAQTPPAELAQSHDWRTRPDPLAGAWSMAVATRGLVWRWLDVLKEVREMEDAVTTPRIPRLWRRADKSADF